MTYSFFKFSEAILHSSAIEWKIPLIEEDSRIRGQLISNSKMNYYRRRTNTTNYLLVAQLPIVLYAMMNISVEKHADY
jgi:hypothetical protein